MSDRSALCGVNIWAAMHSRDRIVLRPIRASDFDGELDALADALRDALPDVGVEVWDPLKSSPGSLPAVSEVLSVILPFAGGYAFNKAADVILGRLRSAMHREEEEPSVRVVEFYGPSGEVLKRIQVSDDADELHLE